MYDIYADGACEPNPGVGGWGVVVYRDGKEICFGFGGDMKTTNNRMEMQSIIEALKFLRHFNYPDAYIYSDSQLCVNTLNSWAKKWERDGWVRKGGAEIKNLDLVKEAYELFVESKAILVWVKGHSGVIGNERADELANKGRTAIINARILKAA